jgi:hypothetical protein
VRPRETDFSEGEVEGSVLELELEDVVEEQRRVCQHHPFEEAGGRVVPRSIALECGDDEAPLEHHRSGHPRHVLHREDAVRLVDRSELQRHVLRHPATCDEWDGERS